MSSPTTSNASTASSPCPEQAPARFNASVGDDVRARCPTRGPRPSPGAAMSKAASAVFFPNPGTNQLRPPHRSSGWATRPWGDSNIFKLGPCIWSDPSPACQSRRDCIIQPMVARDELPWVTPKKIFSLSASIGERAGVRCRAVCPHSFHPRTVPSSILALFPAFPTRVAAARQRAAILLSPPEPPDVSETLRHAARRQARQGERE
jgi:hypothetical protein